ncbi:hypothetical protein ANCCAN_01536, partial [Ancylostoma caninum]
VYTHYFAHSVFVYSANRTQNSRLPLKGRQRPATVETSPVMRLLVFIFALLAIAFSMDELCKKELETGPCRAAFRR